MSGRIPLHVLTGFLGSGKTTLLNRLLRDPRWADSAVLVNEIGAVSLDHHMIERIEGGDSVDIVVLQGGCTCCALRGDMVAALRELYRRRADGAIPPFARAVMETTGLADPAPVLFTLAADPALRHKFEAGAVVTAFDAVHGLAQIGRHPEQRKQIAVADRIVLTKTDLGEARDRAELRAAIRPLNPDAAILDGGDDAGLSGLLADPDPLGGSRGPAYGRHNPEYASTHVYDDHKRSYASKPEAKISYKDHKWSDRFGGSAASDIQAWMRAADAEKLGGERPRLGQSVPEFANDYDAVHTADIDSLSVVLDRPVDWSAFAVWLTLLLHAHGEKMLRFKALLNVAGWPNPVALNGIHHMIHPPTHLSAWPDGPRVSRLVFIAQGLEMTRIESALRAFLEGE